MKIDYTKMHGLKNDFVIIDCRKIKTLFNKRKIKRIADRKKGLGCDQVIILKKPKKRNAHVFLEMYNSDGSETNACGNASRCVAFHLMRELKLKKATIETKAGLLNAFLLKNNHVSIDIGKPYFKWNQIPLKKKMNTGEMDFQFDNLPSPFAVNVGNPHVIFFIDDLKKINLGKIGPRIENDSLFPERINVNFAKILSNNKILLKVWERGSGITKACGTGASATTVAAIKKKLINKNICYVQMDGGKLKIEYKKNGHILMTGPVKYVKKGNLEKII